MLRKISLISISLSLTLVSLIPTSADVGGIPNENARGYWTQEKMANAKPIELVIDEKTGIGKIQPAGTAKGTGKTGTSTSKTIVSTTDWPQGAQIAQTAVGKVFFSTQAGDWVCSGALVKENNSNRAIVLTAGHCAWDQSSLNFVSNWVFVPNYDENPNSTRWAASALIVQDEFAAQLTFNNVAVANDWAFAVLQAGTSGISLPDANGTNAYSLDTTGFNENYASFAFGYPAAPPFNGLSLKYAGATIFTDPKTSSTWGMNSSMTGGASGGPWLSNGTSTDGYVFGLSGKLSSLNSYKYSNDSTKMYGPKFNSKTALSFNSALTADSNVRSK